MAKIETLTLRNTKASEVDFEAALKLLRKKFPKAKVARLTVNDNDEWVARVVTAEFPPKDDGGGEDEAPPPPEDDGGEDDGGESEGPPKEKKEHKPEGEGGGDSGLMHKLLSLVEQLCQAQGIDTMNPEGDMGPDMGGPPGLGPDLPDVGAPSKAPGPPPLPPPAVKQGPGGGGPGGPAFAKRRTVTVWREDDGTAVPEVLKEAQAYFPGYRVAKIERHMGKGANGYEGPVLVTALVAV